MSLRVRRYAKSPSVRTGRVGIGRSGPAVYEPNAPTSSQHPRAQEGATLWFETTMTDLG